MIVLSGDSRRRVHDHLLGASTAGVAGLVNVCSVMAFFAFATNVTGHVAILAEELVRGHSHQLSVVLGWLGAFLFGAFGAALLASGPPDRGLGRKRRLIAPSIELLLLIYVGYYGTHHYQETLRETEVLVGVLLLAMGLQNGLVATVSGGVVKTTHLTGLLTDLGIEAALALRGALRYDEGLRFKLTLHLLVLSFYVVGAISGGLLFATLRFSTFYIGAAVLFGIVACDFALLRQRRLGGRQATVLPEPVSARPAPLASTVTGSPRASGWQIRPGSMPQESHAVRSRARAWPGEAAPE